MLAAVLAARWGVDRAGGGEALQLLAGIAAGVVTYPPLLMWRDPETVADVRGMLARRRAREAAE
jgi:hypothetical protein